MSENGVQVKKLNTKDFWNIVNIFRVAGKEAIGQLKSKEEMTKQEAGMLIFDVGMEHAQKELSKFFAELVNMTVEEYEAAPFDTTLTILEQLEQNENLADFFGRAAKFGKSFFKKN